MKSFDSRTCRSDVIGRKSSIFRGQKIKKWALSAFLHTDQKNASEQGGDVYFSLSFAKKI